MALSRSVVGDSLPFARNRGECRGSWLPRIVSLQIGIQGTVSPRTYGSKFVPDSFLLSPPMKVGGRARRGSVGARASAVKTDGQVVERWWEKNMPSNMVDLHSTQEFVEALANAGDKLVVVEFFATWCGSCRALFPKLCKLAADYPEVLFCKIELEANRQLCKSLNIRVLPFFHFYRGASGRLDAFPASLSKLQRLKDALAIHSTDRCSLGPPAGPEQVLHPDLVPEASAVASPVIR